MSEARPRRARWLAGAALLLAAWPVSIVVRVGMNAAATLHPPRLVPGRTPAGLENVAFRTRDGVTLEGAYRSPQNGAIVVFGHGHGGNRDHMLPQAEELIRRGYGVLAFDWRAHGRSGGERTTWGALEANDLEAALDLACPRGSARRCGGVGFSMGGMAMAHVAARDTRLRAVVLEATPRSLEDMLDHDYGHGGLGGWAAAATLRRLGVAVTDVDPIAVVGAIGPRPLLLVYGDRDDALSPRTSRDMFAAAREPKELAVIRGATHHTYLAAGGDLPTRLARFFDVALAEPSAR
jgi:uncharacterized protein